MPQQPPQGVAFDVFQGDIAFGFTTNVFLFDVDRLAIFRQREGDDLHDVRVV